VPDCVFSTAGSRNTHKKPYNTNSRSYSRWRRGFFWDKKFETNSGENVTGTRGKITGVGIVALKGRAKTPPHRTTRKRKQPEGHTEKQKNVAGDDDGWTKDQVREGLHPPWGVPIA